MVLEKWQFWPIALINWNDDHLYLSRGDLPTSNLSYSALITYELSAYACLQDGGLSVGTGVMAGLIKELRESYSYNATNPYLPWLVSNRSAIRNKQNLLSSDNLGTTQARTNSKERKPRIYPPNQAP